MNPKAPNFRISRVKKSDTQEQAANTSGADAEIEAIQAEGLTGRQLRMARKVAQRNGIKAQSDFDAVRQLRDRGIDPFSNTNMLDMISTSTDKQQAKTQPQTAANAQSTSELRAREVRDIQKDIARRRRKNLFLLTLRMIIFVFLPTFLAGNYYYNIATPLFATQSEMVIKKAGAVGESVATTSLLANSPMATSQDSITVQGFLMSRDAMLRLSEEYGFKDHFSNPDLDPILRLPADASMEDAFDLYGKMVTVSYDPTEGVIKLEVVATDPATSALYSQALISYAEGIVDNLSARLRTDQVRGAEETYAEAEREMADAQQAVIALKEQYNVISTDVEVSMLVGRISSLEQQILQEQLTLDEMLASPNPSPARVDPLQRRIESLQATVSQLRDQLTRGSDSNLSLARIGSELEMAESELQIRTMMLQQSLQTLVASRIEADRQTLYLETGVRPIPPDEPTYPRAFENTILAFLVFTGIYLMLSLTASVLREQLSA